MLAGQSAEEVGRYENRHPSARKPPCHPLNEVTSVQQPQSREDSWKCSSYPPNCKEQEPNGEDNLNQHYPMPAHNRITAERGDGVVEPIVEGGEVPFHDVGDQIPREESGMGNFVKRIRLLHSIVGRPIRVKPPR
jgi:hypothetical protein